MFHVQDRREAVEPEEGYGGDRGDEADVGDGTDVGDRADVGHGANVGNGSDVGDGAYMEAMEALEAIIWYASLHSPF